MTSEDGKASPSQEPGKSNAVVTGAPDAEGTNLAKVLGPLFELRVPIADRRGPALAKALTPLIHGNDRALIPVSVDSEEQPSSTAEFTFGVRCLFCLCRDWRIGRVSGEYCGGT